MLLTLAYFPIFCSLNSKKEVSKIFPEQSTSYSSIKDPGDQHHYVDRSMIHLAGLWLRGAGFRIGDPILVDITSIGLRIRNTQNDPSE